MAVLIFSLNALQDEVPVHLRGAALSISGDAARALQAVVAAPTGTLDTESLSLLDRLATRDTDSDLRLISAAIRSHGSVTINWIGWRGDAPTSGTPARL